MMTGGRKGTGDIISTLTIAVLFIVILLLVVFSAASYKYAADVEHENADRRVELSYVLSCVSDNSLSKISIDGVDGYPGLRIRDRGSRYERRIYMKDGDLLEEYAETGTPAVPDDALVIGKTDTFRLSWARDGLLEIRTDAGASYVNAGE